MRCSSRSSHLEGGREGREGGERGRERREGRERGQRREKQEVGEVGRRREEREVGRYRNNDTLPVSSLIYCLYYTEYIFMQLF